eukprot:4033483-Pyramimonas_sp.AAC.1
MLSDVEWISRRCRGDVEAMSRRCRGDVEAMSRQCRGDVGRFVWDTTLSDSGRGAQGFDDPGESSMFEQKLMHAGGVWGTAMS